MSDAFRDPAAALERARVLEEENAALRTELAVYIDVLENGKVDAGVRRLFEERARLTSELRALRDELAAAKRRPPELVVPRVRGRSGATAAVRVLLVVLIVLVNVVAKGSHRHHDTRPRQASIGPISSPDNTKNASP